MTFAEADSLQSAICTNSASASASHSAFVDASKYIDPAGAAAFTACVQAENGGVRIGANVNDDETLAVFTIAYQAPYGACPGMVTRVDNTGWTCPPPANNGLDINSLVGKQGQLGNQQYALTCSRTVAATPYLSGGQQIVADNALISIATTVGSYTQFFRPKLYANPLADTANVLASYPIGKILPYVGAFNLIPAGWHFCDGTTGMVNLVDRLPIGTSSTGTPVTTATEGSMTHSHPITAQPTSASNNQVLNNTMHDYGSGQNTSYAGHTHTVTGNTDNGSSLPPVTRVYFIQKIT